MGETFSDQDRACLRDSVARARERIERASTRSGRAGVTLVAATKYGGAELCRELAALDVCELGENRVPRLQVLRRGLPASRWHLIGHLQRNKVKKLDAPPALLHSLDSLALAEEISRRWGGCDVLVQVNVAGEEQKGGVAPEALPNFLAALDDIAGMRVRGLMTMAPAGDLTRARSAFRGLTALRDAQRGHDLPELSMGMSGDFELAIEEGATIVRLGRILYEGLEDSLERDRSAVGAV